MEIHDFLPIPDFAHCESLLCVQPHPDDNEIGAGAAIAKLARAGCKITYLTATDGRLGTADPDADPAELAGIRRGETERAGGILGAASFQYLDFEDGTYAPERELCRAIVGVIRRVRPQMVLTADPFLPYEAHPDHRRVGMAAAEACLFSAFPHFHSAGEDTPGQPWQVQAAVFYNTAYPNTYIDADDTWELKKQAILAHESQFDPQSLEKVGFYLDFKSARYGEKAGCARAEAFKVLPVDAMHVFVDAAGF